MTRAAAVETLLRGPQLLKCAKCIDGFVRRDYFTLCACCSCLGSTLLLDPVYEEARRQLGLPPAIRPSASDGRYVRLDITKFDVHQTSVRVELPPHAIKIRQVVTIDRGSEPSIQNWRKNDESRGS